jgi:hypothetical protein
VINKKSYPVQMSAVKSNTDFMEGSLDLKHNCQVVIDRQVTQTIWMFGALWDTAFQVAIPPFRWAVDRGREGAGRIKNYKRNFDFFLNSRRYSKLKVDDQVILIRQSRLHDNRT